MVVTSPCHVVRLLVLSGILVAAIPGYVAAQTRELVHLIDIDPVVPRPEMQFASADKMQQLWLLALEGPEADLQRRVAESIREAIRMGIPGFEQFVPILSRLVSDPETHAQVRFACIKALADLDVKSADATLMQALEGQGLEIALAVEPALARHDHLPMREAWLNRLESPGTDVRRLILAMESLGEVGEQRAGPLLHDLLNSPEQPREVRWAAAQALARVGDEDLVDLSLQWWSANEGPISFSRLVAAQLLTERDGEAVEELLEQYAVEGEPAVGDIALGRLIAIAPDRVRRLGPELLTSQDANLRRWAIDAIGEVPSLEHVELLAGRLVDPHPRLRAMAREHLVKFAGQPELSELVISVAVRQFDMSDWRGLEQSARILAELDHKPASARMAELLDHPRDEVGVTVAWGLRMLDVEETLERSLEYATYLLKHVQLPMDPAHPLPKDVDGRLAHLLQFFGMQKYSEADPLLRQFFSKSLPLEVARSSAMWALGHLHADDPPADLAGLFVGRLQDTASVPPEINPVRQHSAIALGRIKAEAALPALRQHYEMETSNTMVGYSSGWAVEQITGEPVAAPDTEVRGLSTWFLIPVRPRRNVATDPGFAGSEG